MIAKLYGGTNYSSEKLPSHLASSSIKRIKLKTGTEKLQFFISFHHCFVQIFFISCDYLESLIKEKRFRILYPKPSLISNFTESV